MWNGNPLVASNRALPSLLGVAEDGDHQKQYITPVDSPLLVDEPMEKRNESLSKYPRLSHEIYWNPIISPLYSQYAIMFVWLHPHAWRGVKPSPRHRSSLRWCPSSAWPDQPQDARLACHKSDAKLLATSPRPSLRLQWRLMLHLYWCHHWASVHSLGRKGTMLSPIAGFDALLWWLHCRPPLYPPSSWQLLAVSGSHFATLHPFRRHWLQWDMSPHFPATSPPSTPTAIARSFATTPAPHTRPAPHWRTPPWPRCARAAGAATGGTSAIASPCRMLWWPHSTPQPRGQALCWAPIELAARETCWESGSEPKRPAPFDVLGVVTTCQRGMLPMENVKARVRQGCIYSTHTLHASFLLLRSYPHLLCGGEPVSHHEFRWKSPMTQHPPPNTKVSDCLNPQIQGGRAWRTWGQGWWIAMALSWMDGECPPFFCEDPQFLELKKLAKYLVRSFQPKLKRLSDDGWYLTHTDICPNELEMNDHEMNLPSTKYVGVYFHIYIRTYIYMCVYVYIG